MKRKNYWLFLPLYIGLLYVTKIYFPVIYKILMTIGSLCILIVIVTVIYYLVRHLIFRIRKSRE